jgi:hypothetical protein
MGFVNLLITTNMTTLAITPSELAASIVSELGGSESNVDMMIGIGLVKDSEAVYFQYLGDEQTPAALMMPSGKPCTRMSNVRVTGLSFVSDIGEFNSTKLNLFLESSAGRTLMLTSGLTTIWSQCLLTSLMALSDAGSIDQPINLDTWKGTSKMKPCFAAVRQGGVKMSDTAFYEQLRDLRSDGNKEAVLKTCKDAVNIIRASLGGEVVEEAIVTEVTEPTVTATDDLF